VHGELVGAADELVAGFTLTLVASPQTQRTSSIYLASDEQRQDDVVARRERGRLTIDEDRDAA